LHLQIIIDNSWTYLKSKLKINPEFLKRIESEMSYCVEEYSRARKTIIELDISLFERNQLRFPTGLYSVLDRVLTEHGCTFDVNDIRHVPEFKQSLKMHVKKLRDYQEIVLEKAIQSERAVIKVATGGGKTVIAAAIVARLNLKTLFIVYSVDLLIQTADEFESMFGISVGRIGGGYCEIKQINICTVQTLHSAFDIKYLVEEELMIKEKISHDIFEKKHDIRNVVEEAEVVIFDECHKATANTCIQVMQLVKNAYYRFFLSATPFRDKSIDKVLDAYSGKLICNVNASFLIEKGYLVPPSIHILDPNEQNSYKFIKKSFQNIYDEWIVKNSLRNNMIVDSTHRLLDMGKSVLITVSRIPHGDVLCEMLDKAGVKSIAFIKGEVDSESRKKLLDRVRKKELQVLVGTVVADEGIDIPALGSAILAGGGKSLIKSLQRVGRTLRPYPSVENNEKKEAIIVDFYDRIRYLVGHSKKRIKIYESEAKFKVFKHF
jgi:superfamily II DNA or RNA helicase